jgi:inhibitor of KinA sporulation pathway (predicted exonuclease)
MISPGRGAIRHYGFSMPAHRERTEGLKKKLGVTQLCGLPLEGAHHRRIDDARNIVRMLPWIVGGKKAPCT